MFNVYQKKSDYYFEVPARLLGRDMLVVNKLQRVPSELNGEYLGWHSKNLRLVNCRISGTQPLCYAHDLVNAALDRMQACDGLVVGSPVHYAAAGGSTTGGAVVYDDGKFLYSHHATDPCSGM